MPSNPKWRLKQWMFFISLFLLCATCIKLPTTFHTLHLQGNKIYIGSFGAYQLGALSHEWQIMTDKGAQVEWLHKEWGTSIATSALCGSQFEDLPLRLLRQHQLAQMEKVEFIQEKNFMLDGRKALLTQLNAIVDGVPIYVELVVVKKNGCQFDMILAVIDSKHKSMAQKEFRNVYQEFHY